MMGVSQPVHETEGSIREKSLADMVLNDNDVSDARCLFHQHKRIDRMMEHIYEHRSFEAPVRVRNRGAVKRLHVSSGIGLNEYIYSFDRDVGAGLGNEPRKQAVATSNVEYSGTGGQETGQVARENGSSSSQDQAVVQPALEGSVCRCFWAIKRRTP
jgi:hypothetical protein